MVEIKCVYRNCDYELNNIKFDSYDIFGKWVADNVAEITLVDVIQEED